MKDENLSFEWYNPELGPPIVSIAEYGLTFNKSAIKKLNNPEAIKLGFDKKNLIIGIKPAKKEDGNSFEFANKQSRGYIRVNNKGFVKLIRAYCDDYDFEKTVRFIGRMNNEKNIFVVDLNKPADLNNSQEDK